MNHNEVIEYLDETGNHIVADGLRWFDKLGDATPDNFDRLYAEFEAWLSQLDLTAPPNFKAIHWQVINAGKKH